MEVAFGHWSASWPVLIAYVLATGWHLAGLRRLLAATGAGTAASRELRREAALCQLGLLVVLLALVSPVGYFAGLYMWVRALQMLLVGVVGPGLIVLGAPWTALRFAVARPSATRSAAAAGSSAAGSSGRQPWLMSRPLLAVIAANVLWIGWQVPVLFDAARANAAVALGEHASYLAAGLLFWLQMIASRPFSQRVPPLRRVVLLVGTVAAYTVLGMVLVFGSNVMYFGFPASAHHVMSVVSDQQLSGAVLWMGFLPPTMVVAVALMMEWLRNEESADLSAGLDRLLAPRRNGWPSRPVIR
jgi:cytochrome c oxidase assembly factor CtaG